MSVFWVGKCYGWTGDGLVNTKVTELRLLKKHGVGVNCRCPKPCVRHSDHYRAKAMNLLTAGGCPNIIPCRECKRKPRFDPLDAFAELLDALDRQEEANDGEWETDEVGRLRAQIRQKWRD